MAEARRLAQRRPQPRPRRPARPDARRVAFEVIAEVSANDAYANLLLPSRIRRAGLDQADAALATELCYGTLRASGYYDLVIAEAANRAIGALDAPVLDVLRLGAHQLLATRIPAHAAVHETVELAASVLPRSGVGFVNAVLRRISRSTPQQWRERLLAGQSDADALLGIEHAHPSWVVTAFRSALRAQGLDAAELEAQLNALLAADNAAPRVSLVRLLPDPEPGPGLGPETGSEPARQQERSTGPTNGPTPAPEPLPYSPLGLRWPGGDPSAWPPVRQGRVRVQDEGSQLAALALSRAQPIVRGERWLDVCAGPGGKAALLAVEAAAGGAALLANEFVPARAELVRSAVAALPVPPEVVVGDGRRFAGEPARFDRILLDAPCSGLGALRRRPEARWRKEPDDLDGLIALQGQLLAAAAKALKPGGVLAYVTCSPHLRETRELLERQLPRLGALEQLDTGAVLSALVANPLPGIGSGMPVVQLWPHLHGTDAMFIALLRKRTQ